MGSPEEATHSGQGTGSSRATRKTYLNRVPQAHREPEKEVAPNEPARHLSSRQPAGQGHHPGPWGIPWVPKVSSAARQLGTARPRHGPPATREGRGPGSRDEEGAPRNLEAEAFQNH